MASIDFLNSTSSWHLQPKNSSTFFYVLTLRSCSLLPLQFRPTDEVFLFLLLGYFIFERLKGQKFKDIFLVQSCIFGKEDTLKCSGNNLSKVYSVVHVSGKEKLFTLDQWKTLKVSITSCQTSNCYTGTQLFLKSHQHNKPYITQYKINFQVIAFCHFWCSCWIGAKNNSVTDIT